MICLYCPTHLVQSRQHPQWKFCPRCEPEWVKAESHSIQEQVGWVIGDLLLDKGKPYRDGRQS